MYLIYFVIMTTITLYTINSTKYLCVFKIIHLNTYNINILYFNESSSRYCQYEKITLCFTELILRLRYLYYKL